MDKFILATTLAALMAAGSPPALGREAGALNAGKSDAVRDDHGAARQSAHPSASGLSAGRA